MKKTALITFIVLFSLSSQLLAQSDSLQLNEKNNRIGKLIDTLQLNQSVLQKQIDSVSLIQTNFNTNISKLIDKNLILDHKTDSIESFLFTNKEAIDLLYEQLIKQTTQLAEQITQQNIELTGQISQQNIELASQISQTRESTTSSINKLDENLSKNTLYWIIAVLFLGILFLLAFIFLRKKITANKASLTENLKRTRTELEEEAIRLDNKLIQLLDAQLKLKAEDSPEDHSFALKVADEIIRIEKNLNQMDEGTRGLKQLDRAVQRIKDNFVANGYEVVELLGKKYDERMKLTPVFLYDEKMKQGERIITRIIKPQVNYKGEMIQVGQVEVSQGV